MKYEEVTSEAFAERAAVEMSYQFEPADDPEDVVFTGPCPRCEVEMTYTWPLIVVREVAAAPVEEQIEVTVICQCPRTHPGAGGERGCGAYFNLRIPRPG
jgi:hypothetical protein